MRGDAPLLATLAESQRLGYLGARPVEEILAHARLFVHALGDGQDELTVADLGAGGGVPGLVLAYDLPHAHLTMVERRTQRADFLERMVQRHRWTDRVRVVAGDARVLARDEAHAFDAVVARGFGPPQATLVLAARLVASAGRIVLSEPPHGDRWDPAVLERLALRRQEHVEPAGRLAIFHRR